MTAYRTPFSQGRIERLGPLLSTGRETSSGAARAAGPTVKLHAAGFSFDSRLWLWHPPILPIHSPGLSMSTKAARGTKRTCQSNECGARFYDLNRDPIACPICGTIYQIAHATGPVTILPEEKPRKPKKDLVADKELAPEAAAEIEGDEALVDIEEAEDIPADDDETFLEEEEEEGGDVTNIIGGPVAEGEEEV